MVVVKEINSQSRLSWSAVKEVWQHRQLIYFLSLRDFKVRYKQSLVGIGWAFFQPAVAVLLVSLALKNKGLVEGVPYPLFIAIGFVFWFFFSNSLGKISNSLVVNAGIITKIYFPRIIIPISGVFVQLVDFAIGTILVFGMFFFYDIPITLLGVGVYVLMIISAYIAVMGLGFITSMLNARFRDVQFILPFIIQILLFATPVFYYTSNMSGGWWSWLNPMVPILEVVRHGFFSADLLTGGMILAAFLPGIVYFIVGYIIFAKMDTTIIDVI
ncbi:MAG: ABC transporter permease [Patescibacteria group bacterium]